MIGHWRTLHTEDGAAGMPAHVTVLYPFGSQVSQALLTEVGARFASFEFELAELRRFPGTLWLRPERSEPFVAMIEAFAGAFPAFPPYGGEFEDIVPHVTVAHGDERLFAGIERQLAPLLPIRSRATEVALYAFADARWQPQAPFSLNRHDAVAES